jgi:Leucine-rich repeat (LRR) protein
VKYFCRYFAITKGCYDGNIPPLVCNANALESLVLEGLKSGVECNNGFWDPLGILNNAYIGYDEPGTIPTCVWHMPNLKVLHLSANALSGTLPSQHSAAFNSLQDLSLSFNQMTGTPCLKFLVDTLL